MCPAVFSLKPLALLSSVLFVICTRIACDKEDWGDAWHKFPGAETMSAKRGKAHKLGSGSPPTNQPKISKYFTQSPSPVKRFTRSEDTSQTVDEETTAKAPKGSSEKEKESQRAVTRGEISCEKDGAKSVVAAQSDECTLGNSDRVGEGLIENGGEELMDSESTQAYDIEEGEGEGEAKLSVPGYTDRDFCSDSDNDLNSGDIQDMGAFKSKASSSDTEEDTSEPWQTVGSKKKKSTVPAAKKAKTKGKWGLTKRWSDRDTQTYRDGYPGKKDDPKLKDNLRFYKGEIPSHPDGDYIDNIHKEWWGDYRLLERHHGYIQWLFPIREDGMNWQAQALQLHEAQGIKSDRKAMRRVLRSYEMMLDFYGMKLLNEDTGQVARSRQWEERYHNLSWSSHNYLRITRILKSLGELGYEELKKPFLQFVLTEALEHRVLVRTLNSCRDYWIGTVKSDEAREMLYRYVDEHS